MCIRRKNQNSAPCAAGTFFGVQAVFGLLTGSLVSSVQLAISMSNSGGAWDNCKKEIEKSNSEFRAAFKKKWEFEVKEIDEQIANGNDSEELKQA